MNTTPIQPGQESMVRETEIAYATHNSNMHQLCATQPSCARCPAARVCLL